MKQDLIILDDGETYAAANGATVIIDGQRIPLRVLIAEFKRQITEADAAGLPHRIDFEATECYVKPGRFE